MVQKQSTIPKGVQQSEPLKVLTDKTFKENISGNRFALVGFNTDWSGNSYIMDTILGKLKAVYGKNMAFFQINLELSERTSMDYNINKVPTILLFRNGDLIDRINGIISEAELESRIHEVMLGTENLNNG